MAGQGVVETLQKLDCSAFPGATRSNNGHGLPRHYLNREFVQGLQLCKEVVFIKALCGK